MTKALAIAIALAGASMWPVRAQQATFSSKRESVRVDVLVTDHSRPVRGLRPDDFEVLDSGVPQRVDLVSFEQLPVSIVLALDGSSSITPAGLDDLRQGGMAVLGNLKPDDQAALLTFTDAVTLRERLTSNIAEVRTAMEQLLPAPRVSSGTALVDAAYTGMALADSDPGRTLLIAFTDGVDTSSFLPAERVLQVARRSNVVAYAVSTSKLPGGSFLRDLSDVTGGDAIAIASTTGLRDAFVKILEEFRQRYLVSYSPAGVPNDGWHPLTVRVKGRKVDVRARAGYLK
jgi:VWFA-related protein